ncbi:ABC transporter permease [Parafrankia elaeagni]|uniref:ABC transporter permease n=1 Tax=Parafrankia elaeagni TaxID=222534 RepID=UPI0003717310|nr:ABC transporter permease [Parafrankia elaeagni]
MSWLETLRTGLDAIRTHRLRSGLTVLGILIGIAAVVLTVGLGVGAQDKVGSQISSLGSNLLIVSPGSSTSSAGVRGGFGSASTLTTADAAALASKDAAPDIDGVAPVKQSSLSLLNGSTNWTTTVVGTTPDWLSVRSRSLAEGRFLTTTDEAQAAAVTVLAADTASELFGRRSPLGQSVTINNIPFSVVGVLESAGSDSSSNLDDQAIVPMSTGASRLFGGTTRTSVSTIYLRATSSSTLSAAYQEATNLLLNQHGLTGGADSADFTITSQESLLTTATSVSRTLTALLAGIAALSLLVGGIGVMNIMLVSVTERTREIGLRKALGAPPAAIRRQFLIEASLLSLVGGAVGALLGIGGALLLPRFIDSPVAVVWWAVLGSLAVAVAIGVAFGVYPASRAARLAPIDALRSD